MCEGEGFYLPFVARTYFKQEAVQVDIGRQVR